MAGFTLNLNFCLKTIRALYLDLPLSICSPSLLHMS